MRVIANSAPIICAAQWPFFGRRNPKNAEKVGSLSTTKIKGKSFNDDYEDVLVGKFQNCLTNSESFGRRWNRNLERFGRLNPNQLEKIGNSKFKKN